MPGTFVRNWFNWNISKEKVKIYKKNVIKVEKRKLSFFNATQPKGANGSKGANGAEGANELPDFLGQNMEIFEKYLFS